LFATGDNVKTNKDYPYIGLKGDGIDEGPWVMHRGDESFKVYIMFRPPGNEFKDVPLKYMQWTWRGIARKGPIRWYLELNSGYATASSSDETSTHPEWKYRVPPITYVSDQ